MPQNYHLKQLPEAGTGHEPCQDFLRLVDLYIQCTEASKIAKPFGVTHPINELKMHQYFRY